jgi:hypothetical protein
MINDFGLAIKLVGHQPGRNQGKQNMEQDNAQTELSRTGSQNPG